MIIIELSKLEEVLEKSVDDMTSIEMWSAFLGYASDPSRRKLINKMIERKEALGMASTVLMNISKDDHERAKFRSRRKFETDLTSNILTAEERGRRQRNVEIARNMVADGEPIDKIARYTGLTHDEIKELRITE